MKNKIVAKIIAKSVEKLARKGAGKSCWGDWHQPKVPEVLKKEKIS